MLLSCLTIIPVQGLVSVIDEATTEPTQWTTIWQTIRKHVQWNLEYNDGGWTSVKDLLTIDRQYPKPNKCKITLDFITAGAGSYRLTFAVNLQVRKYINRTLQHIWVLQYQNFTLTFDWSDIAGIPNLIIKHGVHEDLFWFRIRKDNIPANYHVSLDPSIVAEVGASTYGHGFQRKSFYSDGRFWQGYGNASTKLYYKSSVDGVTWTDATYVRDGVGNQWSWWYDDWTTYLHYVYANASYGGMIYYRMGQPLSNGTISWYAEQEVYSEAGWLPYEPTICTSEMGYPWIFTHWEKDSDFNRLVIESINLPMGIWQTGSGYPMNLSQHDAEPISGVILPLTGGDMYAIWTEYEVDAKYYGRLFNGTWQTNETICDVDYHVIEQFSVVSRNDDIHLIFHKYPDKEIYYVNYTSGSWGTPSFVWGPSWVGNIHAMSIEDADTEFYVYFNWEDLGSGDWTDVLKGTAESWGNPYLIPWSTWHPEETELTSFRNNWGGFHSCSVVTATEPETIQIYISGSDAPAPTFDSWETVGPVEDSTPFWINFTIGNLNTYEALASCTIELDSGVILQWESGDTFSIYNDDQNLCQLHSASTSNTVGTTQRNLNFSLSLVPSYPEGSIYLHETNTIVTDHWGNTGTESDFILFNFTRIHEDLGRDGDDDVIDKEDEKDVFPISLPVIPTWGYWVIGGTFGLVVIGIIFKSPTPRRRRPKGVKAKTKRAKPKELKGRSKSTGRFK